MTRTVALIATLLLYPGLAPAAKLSVEAMPPVVVKTVPRSGDTKVDPKLDKITVTFSKDMMTRKMWSFVQVSKETFPKTVQKPRYVDKRTIVLPVKLRPGKTYVLWINSNKHDGFRDVKNHPAVPYLLVFETR